MQLFSHLLSSYLQGMGDFFSALYLQRRSGRAGLTGEGKQKYLVYAQFFSADI